MDRRSLAATAALLILCPAAPANGQGSGGTQVFSAEYFEASHPADAYDMLRRLPGFELIEGDEDVRGFTGSRGNVLFDGRAPSGKQESLEQMLRRIPAASVLRIELIRGGAGGAATSGYDLVANVVRRSAASLAGSATAGASAADEIGVRPDVRLEVSRQRGDHRFDGALALETDIDDDSGRGAIIERDADGIRTGRELRDEREVQRTLSADAEYKLPVGAGEMVASLNVARERTAENVRSEEEDEVSVARERERLWSFEAGGQYRAPGPFGGRIEALAVQRLGRLRRLETEEDERFRESTRTGESIGRVEYRREGERLDWFGSVEAALNRLSSDNALEIGGVGVPIAGSDVHVSERRGEAAAGAIWRPFAGFTAEPSLRAELSHIRSTGDSAQSERFLFWKPRLRLSWERSDTRLQATIEREAAQLDFSHFVASAELDRDEITAGATSLRPPTTWAFTALFERRFWGDGALILSWREEWIDDVIDHVVVAVGDELFDAVGNIGDGRRRILKAELTAPFDRLGLPGMQLRAALTFVRSRVTDPVTHQRRIISEDRPFEGELRLTHDIPGGRWSWGAEASLAHREREFRFDETRLERKGTSLAAHVEYRPAPAWRLRAEAANLTSRYLVEERREFDPSRAAGALESTEKRRLRTSPIFIISLRRSFGTAAD